MSASCAGHGEGGTHLPHAGAPALPCHLLPPELGPSLQELPASCSPREFCSTGESGALKFFANCVRFPLSGSVLAPPTAGVRTQKKKSSPRKARDSIFRHGRVPDLLLCSADSAHAAASPGKKAFY